MGQGRVPLQSRLPIARIVTLRMFELAADLDIPTRLLLRSDVWRG